MHNPRLIFANDRTVTGMGNDCKVSTAHVATAPRLSKRKPAPERSRRAEGERPLPGWRRAPLPRQPKRLPARCDFSNLDCLPFRAHLKRDSAHSPFLETVPHAGIARNATTIAVPENHPALLQLFPNVGIVSPWERAPCNANSHAWRGDGMRWPPGVGGKRCAGHFKLFFF